MDRTELADNQFRMTQTREKFKHEGIKNQRDAIEAHEIVGKEVRSAISGLFPFDQALLLKPSYYLRNGIGV